MLTEMKLTVLFSDFMSQKENENSELWSLNVNSQDYVNLSDDHYVFKIYKQCLVTEKIIFISITKVFQPSIFIFTYLQNFTDVFLKRQSL